MTAPSIPQPQTFAPVRRTTLVVKGDIRDEDVPIKYAEAYQTCTTDVSVTTDDLFLACMNRKLNPFNITVMHERDEKASA